jgi:molybdate transport system regulatory protein
MVRKAAQKTSPAEDTRVTLRLDFPDAARLGPGKVRLLELVDEHGSISAAGRVMGMSYRRAWQLVDELNRTFSKPLVETQQGGARGGGAALTETGRDVAKAYREIEAKIRTAAAGQIASISNLLAKR